ncbi:MAG: hypothetical protein HC833_13795, partial [Leptolyngbyaceae cyanobacterium RM1_406_9]|nr:hypothetical protein [Leptolyngbyaceae cyanobacterium RM1_406_9]
MDFWADVLGFAEDVTAKVGQQLLISFGQSQVTEKPDGSLVTQADQWADAELRGAIAPAFPITAFSPKKSNISSRKPSG